MGSDIGLERCGIDENPRVEHVVRVEDRLDLAEEAQGIRGVHRVQQGRACPAVAVLTGD